MKTTCTHTLSLGGFLLVGLSLLFGQNFVNPLPIPYRIDSDNVLLRVDTMQHNFNPNGDPSHPLNTWVTTYAYNHVDSTSNTILGPSIVWRYKHWIHTEVQNDLPHTATTHWHGAHVPPHADGGPHQRIPPDSTWKIDFRVLDKSATMWYHPHVMDHTYEQVQMGMSGMLYVEDPEDGTDDPILVELHKILPTEYGIDDFPIILQTKKFLMEGNTVRIDTACCNNQDVKTQGYKNGYDYVINGVVTPYLEVPANMVRLRILNGDAKFAFNLGLGDLERNREPFQLIATDAGYTDSTYALDTVIIAPGERVEWLVDLRERSVGDTLYLINFANTIPDDIVGSTKTTGSYAKDTVLLKFIVAPDTLPPSPIDSFPIPLHPLEIPPYDSTTFVREKLFTKDPDPDLPSQDIFLINHAKMRMNVVNDTILLGSTEIWNLVNATAVSHPFHIHDIHFNVIEVLDTVTGKSYHPHELPHIFKGPKDNVLVRPGWKLKFVTVFTDFAGPVRADSSYMFHCHILPHEDRGMMGQFVVWDGSTGLDDYSLEDLGLALYPNPAGEALFLEGKIEGPSHISIFDIQGRFLREQKLKPLNGKVRIPLMGLPKGLILIDWRGEGKRFSRKVLLE